MENNNEKKTANSVLKTLEEPKLEIIKLPETDSITTSECLSASTMVTMADGSVKSIEDVQLGDFVLAFNHEAGCFTGSRVTFVLKSKDKKQAFTLRFSNGTTLSIVGAHDLFEKESMKYVCIAEETAKQFIGKHFYSAAENAFVELMEVNFEIQETDYYCINSEFYINSVANGMLNVNDQMDFLLNIYSFGDDLKADAQVLAADIQKYGLFEFSDGLGYSRELFAAVNAQYKNICLGKGLVTEEDLSSLKAGTSYSKN